MHDIVQARTERSPGEGFSLLKEDLWLSGSGFHAGVRGYLAGLPSTSAWREVRATVGDLIAARVAKVAGPEEAVLQEERDWQAVDLSVAGAWARHDLAAAVEWYAVDMTDDGRLGQMTPLVVKVLNSIPGDQMVRVADWIDSHRTEPGWDDQVVVHYLRGKSRFEPNAVIGHLAAIPVREEDRLQIVAGFATPREKDGEQLLRHPPEALHRLIRAANLSPEATERWIRTVEDATWRGS